MEREFLNRFYSTRRTISMLELTNTKQWKDEPVVDYINRWHSLSLDCKDRLSESSGVAMCIQGMHWGLLYMELSLSSHGEKGLPVDQQHKEKKDTRRGDKSSRSMVKESMVVAV